MESKESDIFLQNGEGEKFKIDQTYTNDNDNENNQSNFALRKDDKSLNVAFHLNKNVNEKDNSYEELSGMLQICLLQYIAKKIDKDSINKIKSSEIRNIISDFRNSIRDLGSDPLSAIKENLSQREGKNILNYLNEFKYTVKEKDIKELLSLFDLNVQNQVIDYWSQLSKYEYLNELFKKNIKHAVKESYFDYSLIAASIYQQEGRKKFIEDFNKCDNHVIKLLFHGTQIDPISKIITTGFLYSRKSFYGMGVYLSDQLDFAALLCGGESYEERRSNWGKTIPVGNTFSIVGTFVFYDEEKIKNIYDFSYFVKNRSFPNL